MDRGIRIGLLSALLACAAAGSVAAQGPPAAGDTVSAEAVARGKALYAGRGLCVACHGREGEGGSIGPSLADSVWIHGSGRLADIRRIIRNGISADSSESGQGMPPRGGAGLSDAEVEAVSAYIWSLGRPKAKP